MVRVDYPLKNLFEKSKEIIISISNTGLLKVGGLKATQLEENREYTVSFGVLREVDPISILVDNLQVREGKFNLIKK